MVRIENPCCQNDCDGVMFEEERISGTEKESITDSFLRCDKCGYEQMTMRRTKFLGAIDPHDF